MRHILPLLLLSLSALCAQVSPEQLQALLKKYPDADANKDGVLSMQEAAAYRAKMKAAQPATTPDPNRLPPTIANGQYADNPACVFDFWKAKKEAPAPLIIYIHGGGFKGGSKDSVAASTIAYALEKGFAFMSIGYPFLPEKPVHEILRDCARVVQYARHEAGTLHIDPKRIACFGSSAGAGTSLWIGTHPDLADPKATDPVARESSRIQALGMINGQATYDLLRWEELIGPAGEGVKIKTDEVINFYHLPKEELLTQPVGLAARKEADMMSWLDAGAPPMFIFCNTVLKTPLDRGGYLHHPRHGEVVAARGRELNIVVKDLIGPAAKGRSGPNEAIDFFAAQLGLPPKTP